MYKLIRDEAFKHGLSYIRSVSLLPGRREPSFKQVQDNRSWIHSHLNETIIFIIASSESPVEYYLRGKIHNTLNHMVRDLLFCPWALEFGKTLGHSNRLPSLSLGWSNVVIQPIPCHHGEFRVAASRR